MTSSPAAASAGPFGKGSAAPACALAIFGAAGPDAADALPARGGRQWDALGTRPDALVGKDRGTGSLA